ncbi:MAG: aminoacyl-tRNA hydrolase [Fibrobacteres bacterium]|nr:aminoacyl-tRNA hydrolase [Fibrobacterota bacterium]
MIASGSVAGKKIVLCKPQTFMNLSGSAVLPLFSYYGFTPENMIVVFDDVDLPFGSLRIRKGGGSGGHNGIKSIIGSVGADFVRLRLGIGKPQVQREDGVVSHVLGRFAKEEEETLNGVLEKSADALVSIIENGIDKTMEKYNRKDPN